MTRAPSVGPRAIRRAAPARIAAFRALTAVASGARDLPSALAASRVHLADERDRSLAAAIVHGTLRWQRACDHLIEHASRRPLHTLDADVVVILRLSLFQLLHLDRVPAAAVVDDAVDLTRAAGRASAAGFVNAVLRATLRRRHALPLPPRPDDPADRDAAIRYLGITCSHPDWLVSRWLDRFGFATAERWLQFNNASAPLTLSVNRLRSTRDDLRAALSADGILTEHLSFAPHGLRVVDGNPLRSPSHGRFLVQDEASQLVPLVVDALPGERTLDVCAAPGGKTILMSGDMHDTGVIVACDVRPRRVALLRTTIREAGSRHAHAIHVAPDGPLPFAAVFDRVLVDAPCSGLGTVRRDPDIKWRRRESDLPGLSGRQLMLLQRAACVVGPRGRLVYATCSSEPEENEMIVDAFLAREPAFGLIDLRVSGQPALAPVLDERGMLRTLPFVHGLEAFFAAAMERSLGVRS
jgi:16S rRNA (cytosine967-C5)-methyltransferase